MAVLGHLTQCIVTFDVLCTCVSVGAIANIQETDFSRRIIFFHRDHVHRKQKRKRKETVAESEREDAQVHR